MSKITAIELENFRCYEKGVVPLGERTLIVGPNGSGKSSIQDALSYALTGACRGTTRDGKGIEAAIRTGADEFSVALRTENGTVTRGMQRGSRGGAAKRFALGVESFVNGTPEQTYALSVRPDVFHAEHPRDQANIMLGFAGVSELTPQALLDAGLPKELRAYCHDFTESEDGEYVPSASPRYLTGSLAGLQAFIARIREDRADAGREVDELEGAVAVAEAADYDEVAHKAATNELEAAQSANLELTEESARKKGEFDEAERGLREQLGKYEAEQKALSESVPPAPDELTAERARILDAIAGQVRIIQEAEAEKARLGGDLERVNEQLAAADSAARAERQDRLTALQTAIDETDAKLAELPKLMERGTSDMAERMRQADERITAAREAVEAQEQARATKAAAAKQLEKLTTVRKEREGLDRLVRILDGREGDVRSRLLDEHLGTIRAELSEAVRLVSAVTDSGRTYDCVIGFDDQGGLDLQIVKEVGDRVYSIPFRYASAGEQTRLTWAVQAMAGLRSGIVVLDAGENLDNPLAAFALGDWLAERGVQVLVTAIDAPDAIPAGWTVRGLVEEATS